MLNTLFSWFREPPPSSEAIKDPNEIVQKYRYWQWWIFWGTFVGYATFYFCRNNFPSTIPKIMEEFGYTKTQLGLLTTTLFWVYAIGKFVNGVLADRSNIRIFMGVGLILSALMNILFGFSSSLVTFALIWGANGWFQSMGWPPCAKALVHWWSSKVRGFIWGLWSSSHQIGGAIIVALAAWLAQEYGWRSAFFIPASIAIVVALFLFIVLRDRPAVLGLPSPENRETEGASHLDDETPPVMETLKKDILSNGSIWLLAFQNFCIYVVRYGSLVWTVTFLVEVKHSSLAAAGGKTSVIEIAGIFGNIFAGWISDRVGGYRNRINVFYFFTLAIAVHFFWFVPGDNLVLQLGLLGVIGFLIYGPQLLLGGVCTVDMVPKRAAAAATGFVGMFGYFGSALVAGLASGVLIDVFGWRSMFYVWTGCSILGGILSLLLWNKRPFPPPQKN